MRLLWLTSVAACLAVQGCAPPPGSYYGAPPGYAPQPYAATPGVAQPPLDAGYPQQDADPGYPSPAYAAPGTGYYEYGYAPPPPPAYGYAPPPFLAPGFYGGRDRFERDRFRGDRFLGDRGRERFERERFERQQVRERVERDRPRPPPGQPLQGPARPQDFRQPAGGPQEHQGHRGFTPEQLRRLP